MDVRDGVWNSTKNTIGDLLCRTGNAAYVFLMPIYRQLIEYKCIKVVAFGGAGGYIKISMDYINAFAVAHLLQMTSKKKTK